jgi:hypothetical protein
MTMKAPRDLEVSIGYRLPETVMKRLAPGDCNAPNVLIAISGGIGGNSSKDTGLGFSERQGFAVT